MTTILKQAAKFGFAVLATGVSRLLARGCGTVYQLSWINQMSRQDSSDGFRRRFCLSETAAHSDFSVFIDALEAYVLTYLLTYLQSTSAADPEFRIRSGSQSVGGSVGSPHTSDSGFCAPRHISARRCRSGDTPIPYSLDKI